MTEIGVLIPVLNRPQNAEPVVASIFGSRSGDYETTPIFLISPDDDAEREAVLALDDVFPDEEIRVEVVPWQPTRGDYQKKINHGFRTYMKEFDWFLFGADDLVFHHRWADEAMAEYQRTWACVIGTNDLGNWRVISGIHSTHPLVHRDYIECGTADEAGKLYHEDYWHQYCDDEFVQTAKVRNTYSHAFESHVEHLHPDWGKAEMDETYNRSKLHVHEDMTLYMRRRDLWLS